MTIQNYSQKIREYKSIENNPEKLFAFMCKLVEETQMIYNGDSSLLNLMIPEFSSYLFRNQNRPTFAFMKIRAKIYTFFYKFSFEILKTETVISLVNIASNSLFGENVENSIICISIIEKAFENCPNLHKSVFSKFFEFFKDFLNRFSSRKLSYFCPSKENTELNKKGSSSTKTLFFAMKLMRRIFQKKFQSDRKIFILMKPYFKEILALKIDQEVIKLQEKELTHFFQIKTLSAVFYSILVFTQEEFENSKNNKEMEKAFFQFFELLKTFPKNSIEVFKDLIYEFSKFVSSFSPQSLFYLGAKDLDIIWKKLTYGAHEKIRSSGLKFVSLLIHTTKKRPKVEQLRSLSMSLAKTIKDFRNFESHKECFYILSILNRILINKRKELYKQNEEIYLEILEKTALMINQYLEAILISLKNEQIKGDFEQKEGVFKNRTSVWMFMQNFEKIENAGKHAELRTTPNNPKFELSNLNELIKGSSGDGKKTAASCGLLITNKLNEMAEVIGKTILVSNETYRAIRLFLEEKNLQNIENIRRKKFLFSFERKVYEAQCDFYNFILDCFVVFNQNTYFGEKFYVRKIENKNIHLFCKTMAELRSNYFRYFANNNIPDTLELMEKGLELETFKEILKGFSIFSSPTISLFDSILMCLKNKIPILNGVGKNVKITLNTFDIVFEISENNSKVKDLISCYFRDIVKKCVSAITTGLKDPKNFIILLSKMFGSTKKKEDLYKKVVILMPSYIKKLAEIIRAEKKNLSTMAMELSMHLPAKFCFSEEFILQFILNLIECFKSNVAKLQSLAIKKLKGEGIYRILNYFDNKKTDQLYGEFMRAFCALTDSKHFRISEKTIGILGEIGGKNRLFLELPYEVKISPKNNFVKYPVMINSVLHTVPAEPLFRRSLEILKESKDIKATIPAFNFVRIFISSLYDFSIPKESKTTILKLRFNKINENKDLYLNYFFQHRKIETLNSLLEEGVSGLLKSLNNDACYPRKSNYMDSLGVHTAVLCLTESGKDSINPKSYIKALIRGLGSNEKKIREESANLMKKFVRTSVTLSTAAVVRQFHENRETPIIFDYINAEFIYMCNDCDFHSRLAAINGFLTLYSNYPPEKKHNYAINNLKHIFKALTGLENEREELKVAAKTFIKTVLKDELMKNKDVDSLIKGIFVKKLIKKLSSSSLLARICSQESLAFLKTLTGVPEIKVLKIHPPKINILALPPHKIKAIPFDEFSRNLAYTNYYLSLTSSVNICNPLVAEPLVQVIEEIINNHTSMVMKLETENNLYFRYFLVKLNQKLKMNGLAFLASVSAFIERVQNQNGNNNFALRLQTKFVLTLVKFLERSKDFFLYKKTMDYIKSYLSVYLKSENWRTDYLKRHIEPIMIKMIENKRFNYDFVKSVKKTLKLFDGTFSPLLGTKLLKTLDDINKVNFGKKTQSGDQIVFPLLIFDFLVNLPPCNELSFKDFIVLTSKFEEDIPQIYGYCSESIKFDSPFNKRLIERCQKFPDTVIKFFAGSEYLCEPKFSNLIISLIKKSKFSNSSFMDYFNKNINKFLNPAENVFRKRESLRREYKSMMVKILYEIISAKNICSNPSFASFLIDYLKKCHSHAEKENIIYLNEYTLLACKSLARLKKNLVENKNIFTVLTWAFKDLNACNATFVIAHFREKCLSMNENMRTRVLAAFSAEENKYMSVVEKLKILRYIIAPILTTKTKKVPAKFSKEVFHFFEREFLNLRKQEDDYIIEILKILVSCIGRFECLNEKREEILKNVLQFQCLPNSSLSIWSSVVIGKLVKTFSANDKLVLDLFRNIVEYSSESDIKLVFRAFKYLIPSLRVGTIGKLILLMKEMCLLRTISISSCKIILAIIIKNKTFFLPYNKVLLDFTTNHIIENKDELNSLVLNFLSAMVGEASFSQQNCIKYVLQEKIFSLLINICFEEFRKGGNLKTKGTIEKEIEKIEQESGPSVIEKALRVWSLQSFDLEMVNKRLTAVISIKNHKADFITKLGVRTIEILIGAFRGVSQSKLNMQLFGKWMSLNMPPLILIFRKIMFSSSKTFLKLCEKFFEIINDLLVNEFLFNGLKTFYDTTKKLAVESLRKYIMQDFANTRKTGRTTQIFSEECAFQFLISFEEKFHFCRNNNVFVSEIISKILSPEKFRTFQISTPEEIVYPRYKIVKLLFKLLLTLGPKKDELMDECYSKLAIIVSNVPNMDIVKAIFKCLEREVKLQRNICRIDIVAGMSDSILRHRKKHPVMFEKYLRFLILFFEIEMEDVIFERFRSHIILGTTYSDELLSKRFLEIFIENSPNDVFLLLKSLFEKDTLKSLRGEFWLSTVLKILICKLDIPNKCITKSKLTVPTLMLLKTEGNKEDNRSPSDHVIHNAALFARSEIEVEKENISEFLSEVAVSNKEIVYTTWKRIFPLVWSTIGKDQQKCLCALINSFLGEVWVSEATDEAPNASESLKYFLGGIAEIYDDDQLPALDSSLLFYIAAQHRAWHEVEKILSRRRAHLRKQIIKCDLKEINNSLLKLYSEMNERESFIEMWNEDAKCFWTVKGLYFGMLSLWQHSKKVFEYLIERPEVETELIPEEEKILWTSEWIKCAKKLSEWDVLSEFANETNNVELQLETCWKSSQWNFLKQLTNVYSMKSNFFVRHGANYDLYVSLMMHSPRMNFQLKLESALRFTNAEWKRMPRHLSSQHSSLLCNMQRILELKESCVLLKHSDEGLILNMRPTAEKCVEKWRKRLPNKGDSIEVWDEIFRWRLIVFKELKKDHLSPKVNGLQLDENFSWSVAMMSKISRKKNDVVTAARYLKFFGSLEDTSEKNFYRLYELQKILSEKDANQEICLKKISAIDLAQFTPKQNSKLLLLKANFLRNLNKPDEECNISFRNLIAIEPSNVKAWIEWAKFCENCGNAKTQKHFQESALCCFLSAVIVDCNSAKIYLSRVIWILAYSNEDQRLKYSRLLRQFWSGIPLWVWIFWIPLVVSALLRSGRPIFELILGEIAKVYPQAMFNIVKTLIDEKRSSDGSHIAPNKLDRVYAILKKHHNVYTQEVESLISSLVGRFKPSIEEELFSAVSGILNKCYRACEACDKIVPREVSRTTTKILTHFFTRYQETASDIESRNFVEAFKKRYNNEILSILNDEKTTSLSQLIHTLQGWKRFLLYLIGKNGSKIRLSRLSSNLESYEGNYIEIFGQYNTFCEPILKNHVLLSRFDPMVEITCVNGYYSRRLTLISQWGTRHVFVVMLSLAHMVRMEQRQTQLCLFSNHMLGRFGETRAKGLFFNVQTVVPLSGDMLLLETPSEHVNLNFIWEEHCREIGEDPEEIFLSYLEDMKEKNDLASKAEFIKNVARKYKVNNCIKNFFQNLHPSEDRFWAFRKTFTKQYALLCFFEHVFMTCERYPFKKHINMASGKVGWIESYPFYNNVLRLEEPEQKYFRLTPEIIKLMSPAFFKSLFTKCLKATSACMIKYGTEMKYFFYLYLMDDMSSWTQMDNKNFRKTMPLTAAQIKESVRENTFRLIRNILMFVTIDEPNVNFEPNESKIFDKAARFIELSCSEENLARMPLISKPWF